MQQVKQTHLVHGSHAAPIGVIGAHRRRHSYSGGIGGSLSGAKRSVPPPAIPASAQIAINTLRLEVQSLNKKVS